MNELLSKVLANLAEERKLKREDKSVMEKLIEQHSTAGCAAWVKAIAERNN